MLADHLTRARSAGQAARTIATELAVAGQELRRARAESAAHEPTPPAAGLVVDVGGGQRVHPRADLLVEKYVADDFERPGEEPVDLTRPLVVADAEALPFADGSFSYAIASHVLEHARSPERFASELARIVDAGFVQVPSRESELTFGWEFHPWLIDRDGDMLVFEPRGDRVAPFGAGFHDAYGDSALFRLWWSATRSRWHHSIEWRGALTVRVLGESAAIGTATFDAERTKAVLAAAMAAGRLQPFPEHLRALVRCPACDGDVAFMADRIACATCARSYPLSSGVPILLAETAA